MFASVWNMVDLPVRLYVASERQKSAAPLRLRLRYAAA
jgi:hypothetical protein